MAANEAVNSKIKFGIGADKREAETALIDLRERFMQLRREASKGIPLPDLKLLETQVKAGLRPLDDLKKALALTIAESKAANKIEYSPINEQRIAEAVIRLKQLRAEEEGARNSAQSLVQTLGDVGSALQQAFLPLAAISASIGAVLTVSANQFKDFERTLNTIAAVGDLTDQQLDRIRQSAVELGQSTVFNNKQVAESYLELTRAGFTVEESLEAVPGLLQLAAAAGGDLAVATSAVAEGMRAFGLETSRTGEFADLLAQAANKSSADVGDLAEAFKQVAPVARQTNQPIQDVTALLALLADNSIKGADAGSDLRNIITRLLDPSKEAAAVLKQLNVSLSDSQGNVKPLSQLFKELGVSLSQYNDKSKAVAASTIAGQENLKTFLTLAAQSPATIDKMVKALNNADGAAGKMADTINQGLFASLEQLGGALDTLKTQLGDSLAPAIKGVAGAITELATAAAKNKPFVQFAAGALAAVAAATTLATALGGLLSVIGPLQLALARLSLTLPVALGGLAGLAVAAGLITIALNGQNEALKLSERTIADLTETTNTATQSELAASRQYAETAKNVDELRKKQKLTQDEKALLRAETDKLTNAFDKHGIDLQKLVDKYGDYSKAVAEARIQQAAFAREEGLQKELKTIQQLRKEANRDAKITLDGVDFGAALERQQSFAKQEEELKNRIKSVNSDVRKEYAIQNAADKAFAAKGTKNLQVGAKNNNKTQINAAEQLTKQLERIQEDATGFALGEYAKQRLAAENNYKDQVRQLERTAATAKQSGSAAVIEGLQNLKNNYLRTLQEIDKQEKRSQLDARRTVEELKSQIASLNAGASIANPFDDITTQADLAADDINRSFSQSIRALNDLATKNPALTGIITETRALYQQVQTAQLESLKEQTEQQKFEQLRALRELQQQNLVGNQAIGNDTLAIERATNAAVLADLDLRIERQKELLAKAKSDLSGNKSNVDLQLGFENAEAQLKKLENDRALQAQASAQRQADIEVAAAKRVVDAVQNQIDLLGERPELVAKLVAANDAYIKQLEQEARLTNLSAEKRAEIEQLIRQSRASSAQITAQNDGVARFLQGFQNFRSGNNSFDTAIQGLAGNIQKARQEYAVFQEEVKKGNVQGGFKNFLFGGSNELKSNFANIANGAISALSAAFGNNKSKLAGVFTNAFSTIGNALQAGPAAPFALAIQGLQNAANTSGGFLKKYAAFIDPLGFRKLFGGGGKTAAQKAAENLARTQKYLTQLTANLDSNNLTDLTNALNATLRYKSGGGEAFQLKRQTALQIQKSIDDRNKVIQEAIKDLTFQNSALTKAFAKYDDQPFENLKIDRDISLDSLIRDRDKALEQYKDSLEVQKLIEKNFQLEREALYKQSAADIIAAVIEEQNTISSLRAETAVNDAKTSGNQIAIINANLQAQLVAIDNDIAAFKGAEEEKTEFLKSKTAERNAIIKEANDQVNQLFKDGLDILNEGLVVGQTKAQSQAARLKELFGSSLNPLGLIDSAGNLVQTAVNIGAGGIQFILPAIKDAEDLIAQLSTDPILQGKLIAALNAVLART